MPDGDGLGCDEDEGIARVERSGRLEEEKGREGLKVAKKREKEGKRGKKREKEYISATKCQQYMIQTRKKVNNTTTCYPYYNTI